MNIDEIKDKYKAVLDPDVYRIHIATEEYEWLVAQVERQKHRADQLQKQIPAIKRYIEELEFAVEELGKLIIKTKDWAFQQIVKSCDKAEKKIQTLGNERQDFKNLMTEAWSHLRDIPDWPDLEHDHSLDERIEKSLEIKENKT